MINKNYDVQNVYKARVKDLNDVEKDDVIISFQLLISSTEENKSAELLVGIELNIDDISTDFISINQLTKEKLIEWALATIDEEKSKKIDRILKNKLDNYKEPVKTPVVVERKIFDITANAE